MQKSADAFRTISEVADDLSLPQHVLRFWETRFPQIRPLKRAGGRRYYRPGDVSLLKAIRRLLYEDGYTIKGVQRLLKEQGAKGLSAVAPLPDLDWQQTEDQDVDIVPTDAPFPPPVEPNQNEDAAQTSPSTRSHPHRRTIAEALTIVDECKQILDAALRPPR